MITNERELRAAEQWIAYWKSTRSGQSWIGNEQAIQKMIQLRRQIDDYRRRAASASDPVAEDPSLTPS